MIAVDITGGLGNQMFQYAIGRSLSIKSGEELLLNTSYYDRHLVGHTPRRFELPIFFNISARKSPLDRITIQVGRRKLYKYYFLRKRLRRFYEQTPFRYDHAIEDVRYPARLSGYWQCPKYFRGIEPVIRRDFAFKNISVRNRKIAKQIESESSVSIHIRRTDYLVPGRDWICDLDYFRRALSQLVSLWGRELTCYIFSDDLAWVKTSFCPEFKTVFVDWNSGIESGYDMWLMSQCQHNIISNSTFSWWGAWLNNRPDKIVIGPRKWTHDENNAEIMPPNWQTV